jgi:uncharacterized membrane protein YedE/YeeE
MTPAQVATLQNEVLGAAFLVALVLGALLQRTGFCTMGAVSDVVAMGDWTRLRQWAMATAVATLGFAVLAATGMLRAPQTLYGSSRWLWLSAALGGAAFGFGMVLASGCVSRNLVRLGGGSLKALVVALVTGIAAFATLKGLTAVWRVNSVDRIAVDVGTNADLATLLARASGMAPAAASLLAGLAVGGALLAFALSSRDARRPLVLAGGAGVGALVLAMFWVTGHLGHLAEHPETLEETWLATNSMRAEGISFVAPTAYALDWVMFFSDAGKRLTVGIVAVVGVVAGAAGMALARRDFRWQGFGGTRDLGQHLAGAGLMGVGGVTAVGCSIGQGVTGVSTLSLTSFVAASAMIAGAILGVRYQMWRLERDTG